MKKLMKIEKRSPFSGDVNTMLLLIDPADYAKWAQGALIQNAMPYLTNSEREFLITGITPDEWAEAFSED
jgi:hypothetical protein